MLFRDFLQGLRDCGDSAVADEISKAIVARFKGVRTVEQLLLMDMNEINGTLNIAKMLKQNQKRKNNQLQDYVESLQAKGFTVSVNPKYQHLLNSETE